PGPEGRAPGPAREGRAPGGGLARDARLLPPRALPARAGDRDLDRPLAAPLRPALDLHPGAPGLVPVPGPRRPRVARDPRRARAVHLRRARHTGRRVDRPLPALPRSPDRRGPGPFVHVALSSAGARRPAVLSGIPGGAARQRPGDPRMTHRHSFARIALAIALLVGLWARPGLALHIEIDALLDLGVERVAVSELIVDVVPVVEFITLRDCEGHETEVEVEKGGIPYAVGGGVA